MVLVRRFGLLALLLTAPLTLLVVLRARPRLDVAFFNPGAHLVVVSGIAACALVTACVAVASAARSRHPSSIWLGVGCATVGILMVGHGLLTPGQFGRGSNQWVSRFPHLALLAFAIALSLAGRPPGWGPNRLLRRRPILSFLAVVAPVLGLVIATIVDESFLHGMADFAVEEDVFDLVSLGTAALLIVSIRTHWRRWQLGHDIVQFAIVLAAAMSIAAVTAFQHGRFGQLSWWDYHGFLLAGFGAAVYAVFRRGRSEQTITTVLDTAFADDPFEHIQRGYPESLRSLVRAVEIKDAYTHGHSERTAHLAVEIGLKMRLPPDRLRAIARGAFLHDLGKIGIPDHILNKPGPLSADERAVIETHPQLGYEMASVAPSLNEALSVILHHHERVDGGGYPHGLRGSEIPIEARIVAVADVWDALTSDRSYRPGWSAEDALAHIEAAAGSHFDLAAVDALRALAVEWGVRAGSVGTADEAWTAAQTCHEIDEPATEALASA